MERDVLQKLVDKGYTNKRMSIELGVHVNTIYRWMLKHDLMICPKKLCKRCGQNEPGKFDIERHTVCRKCRHRRNRNKKLRAIEYKGGKCAKCGYNRCPSALDFHHNDPAEKDYQWNRLRHKSVADIEKELDKCTLLCKNCHAEIHWEWSNAIDK